MYIALTLIIILICLIVIKVVINDMAIRITSIVYKCDYKEVKELMKKK